MKNFIKSLKFIFMPHFWIMEARENVEWEQEFCKLVEQHDFVPSYSLDGIAYTAYLGEHRVWVANYPYAFFSSCGVKGDDAKGTHFHRHHNRPSRAIICKYYNKLKLDLAKYDCVHA